MTHEFICIGEIHSNQNISNILLQNNKQKLLGLELVVLGESIAVQGRMEPELRGGTQS